MGLPETLELTPSQPTGTASVLKEGPPVSFEYQLVPVLGVQVLALSITSDDSLFYPFVGVAHVAEGGVIADAVDVIDDQYDRRQFDLAAGKGLDGIYLGAYDDGVVYGRIGWTSSLESDDGATFTVEVAALSPPAAEVSGWIITDAVLDPADVPSQLWPTPGSGYVYPIYSGAEDVAPVRFADGAGIYRFAGATAYLEEDPQVAIGLTKCTDYQNTQVACYITATPP
jgi:hypothetical protein